MHVNLARFDLVTIRLAVTCAQSGSLSAAARELGVTTPAVSRHLAQMEARLGLALVNRTTRRMSLTPEGELYLEHARRILGEIDDLNELLGQSRRAPQGLLRVNATLGFGRSHVAPVISRFARKHPQVEVQLQLSVNPPPLTEELFDVCIRFGAPPDSRVIARYIAPNRRLLCASPAYLAKHGVLEKYDVEMIGASREMLIASLAEPAMLMIVFTLALLAGSTQLSSIAAFMQGSAVGLRV